MKGNAERLQAKRQNAIDAIENLLRVVDGFESMDWVRYHKKLLEAVQSNNDSESLGIEKSGVFVKNRWKISDYLRSEVSKTITNLRVYLEYDLDNPLVQISRKVPKIQQLIPEKQIKQLQEAIESENPLAKPNEDSLEYDEEPVTEFL